MLDQLFNVKLICLRSSDISQHSALTTFSCSEPEAVSQLSHNHSKMAKEHSINYNITSFFSSDGRFLSVRPQHGSSTGPSDGQIATTFSSEIHRKTERTFAKDAIYRLFKCNATTDYQSTEFINIRLYIIHVLLQCE